VLSFELDGCHHAKRGATALTIVKDLDLLEDGVR
jgi:hypothetical protein